MTRIARNVQKAYQWNRARCSRKQPSTSATWRRRTRSSWRSINNYPGDSRRSNSFSARQRHRRSRCPTTAGHCSTREHSVNAERSLFGLIAYLYHILVASGLSLYSYRRCGGFIMWDSASPDADESTIIRLSSKLGPFEMMYLKYVACTYTYIYTTNRGRLWLIRRSNDRRSGFALNKGVMTDIEDN